MYSRYPRIKGLDISLFIEQIEYLKCHYKFITMEMLVESINSNIILPSKSVLITFDDGYIDHYINVFPILSKYGIQGSFFPPIKAVTEHIILDVNKIHFILATVDDTKILIKEIYKKLDENRSSYNLNDNEFYYSKLARANLYDTKDTVFIKKLLQVELVEELRQVIVDHLFKKFVGINQESFSSELYMNIEQIKCLQKHGMHIGSHGYNHYWLGSLSEGQQRIEIERSSDFLGEIGANENYKTMSYPYGDYNSITLELLNNYNYKLAVTTEINVADLQKHHALKLPRLDTNDLPKEKDASQNNWYDVG